MTPDALLSFLRSQIDSEKEVKFLEACSSQNPEDALESMGILSRSHLYELLAESLECESIPFLDESASLPVDFPDRLVTAFHVWPINRRPHGWLVAMLDPFDTDTLQSLSFELQCEIAPCIAPLHQLRKLLARWEQNQAQPTRATSSSTLEEFHRLLSEAIDRRASDAMLESTSHALSFYWRIDGQRYHIHDFPTAHATSIVVRIKHLAKLDIAQSRRPQDGKIRWEHHGRHVDIRVATLPTVHGESITLRLLDPHAHTFDLANLGMSEAMLSDIEDSLKMKDGLWVVTGPTGAGKTTTLHACLKHIAKDGIKIISVEDPIEYELDAIQQIAVHESIGLTFPHALRALLRHDPDYILIGETRDSETARIGVQAALTGHLVFTSLHTSDAAEAITRFLDMGIEPYFLAAVLRVVLAQMLLRRLCPHCKTKAGTSYIAQGCKACFHTGTLGRVPVFQQMKLSDALHQAILERQPTSQLRLLNNPSQTLLQDAQRWMELGEISESEAGRLVC